MHTNIDLDFQLFYNLNLDILCVNNAQGKFESINKGFELTLGYTFEEIRDIEPRELVHPDDLKISGQAIANMRADAKVIQYTNRIRHKDGHYLTIEWKNYPADGFIYATGRDITAIKAKEAEALVHQQRLNAIIESDNSYIFRVGLDHKYTFANPYFLKEFLPQYTSESIIGVRAESFTHNEAIELVSGDPAACIHNLGVNYQIELKRHLPDGDVKYYIWDCICFADAQGKPSEVQMVGIDITQKRKTEQELKAKKEMELLDDMTPITRLWEGILFCPITGVLTPHRAENILTKILKKIADTQAKVIILDIIGIPYIDTQAAIYFVKLSKATQLMGCICTMSGLSAPVAEALVESGVQMEELSTTSNMKDALEKALSITGLEVQHLKQII